MIDILCTVALWILAAVGAVTCILVALFFGGMLVSELDFRLSKTRFERMLRRYEVRYAIRRTLGFRAPVLSREVTISSMDVKRASERFKAFKAWAAANNLEVGGEMTYKPSILDSVLPFVFSGDYVGRITVRPAEAAAKA